MSEPQPYEIPPATHPTVRPKDAATLIVLDRSGPVPKVLLGKRHSGHVFMPNALVFPGGRVDPSDTRISIAAPLTPATERRLLMTTGSKGLSRARALAVAAIRELYEETGLCIGTFADTPPQRHDLSSPFAQCGLQPDLSRLRLVARAITPPGRIRRFDTRFFIVDAATITYRIVDVVGDETELVELVWLPIAQAKEAKVPQVTRLVLGDLERLIAAGYDENAPIPFYHVVRGRGQRDLF